MAATDSSPLTWRSATLAAALLAAVGVLAGGSILAQRPQGPPMGATAASTILDETGKPVGAGPPIGIIGPPAASGPAAGADDPAVAALWWFAGFLDAYARLERDMAMIKTVLRANWIAIRELEADLVADRATLDNARGDQLRSYMTLLVNAKQQKLNELRAEQASLLKAALGRWEDFTQCLREKSAGYASLPLVQRALGGFGTFLDQKRLVGEMELNLSAGRSQEFRVLADRAQADPSLQAVTLHYRVQDYLDRGEMGMALHAARVGAARYKDTDLGGVMTTQAQSLEVAFLKLISSKADSTAAEIRRTWETYSGEVSDSTIKQGLFGSVRHGIDSLIGRTNALRDLATDSQERLVLEHNGVEVAWRLREKGLSTEEIRLMTPEKLRDTWPRVFRQTISWESADAMTLSIQAAFQNEDVKKLAFGGDMRTLDLKPSWMGQKEFDAGLFGTCVDAVNVKNVLLLAGPGAIVKSGGSAAGAGTRFARAFGRGAGAWERIGAMAETGLKDAVTARDWLIATPAVRETAAFLAKTNTGKALREGLTTWCAARYQGPTAVKAVMGAEEVLAQMVVFEAGGKIGKAVGGQYGEFVGQALAVLAGNPIHDIQQARVGAIKAQVAEFRQKLSVAESAAARVRTAHQSVEAAAVRVSEGQALAETEIAQARRAALEASEAADDIVAAERRASQAAGDLPAAGGVSVQPGASRLTEGVREQAELVVAEAEAVVAGERIGSAIVSPKAKKAGTLVTNMLEDARKSADAMDNAALAPSAGPRASASVEMGPGGSPVEISGPRPATAKTLEVRVGGSTASPPPGEAAAPTPVRQPSTHAEAYEMGEEALRTRDFAAARSYYRSASQFEDITADDAALYVKRMREAEHAERFASAMAERRASGKFTEYTRQCDDALRQWTQAELDDVARLNLEDMPLVSAATGRAETAAAPRFVLDAQGRKVGVFKEARLPETSNLQMMPDDGNLVNEVAVARMYRDFGLLAPAAAEVTVQGATGPVRGVVIRWIPGVRQLQDISPGARSALADQVAQFKAAAVFTGNYDVHMGNFVYDQVGRVWHIDHGMACLKNSWNYDQLDWLRGSLLRLSEDQFRFTGNADLDFARLLRDLYRNGGQARAEVVHLDRLVRGQDMQPVFSKIRRVDGEQIERWVGDLVKRDTPEEAAREIETIKASLLERKRTIDELLDPWPGAVPGQPQGTPRTRPGTVGAAWSLLNQAWQSVLGGRFVFLRPQPMLAGWPAW